MKLFAVYTFVHDTNDVHGMLRLLKLAEAGFEVKSSVSHEGFVHYLLVGDTPVPAELREQSEVLFSEEA